MSIRRLARLAPAVLLVVAVVAGQPAKAVDTHVDMEWVAVGDPGNAPDTDVMSGDRTTGYGSVPYEYLIGKYLVTNEEYAKFLNAVAREADPYLLWFPCMDQSMCYGVGSGIKRFGNPGNYSYMAEPGRERYPVNYVNLFMALRFANWMNNGQGRSSTETGAYTLRGGTPFPTNFVRVERNPGASVYLSSEDEWYKAAYYDPANDRYYDFPAGTDEEMECTLPGPKPNTGNCGLVTAEHNPANPGITGVASWFFGDVTEVGAYTNSASPVGAYDMGGNLFQWTDVVTYAVTGQYHIGGRIAPLLDATFSVTGNPFVDGIGPCGVVRGTDWGDGGEFNAANGRTCDITLDPFETYGFRLVRVR